MIHSTVEWAGFLVLVVALLLLDLGLFNRGKKEISVRKALILTAFWIGVAMAFNVYVLMRMGQGPAMEFLAGYVVEKSMSVDNLFVFLLVFSAFGICSEYQHKALFYGIVGALVFRAIFIFAGVELLERFGFMMYIFGAFLLYAALKTVLSHKDQRNPRDGRFAKFLCKHMRTTEELHGDKLFTRKDGMLFVTPMFIAILVIEMTDLVFAIDSIPAVLAVTTDTFIVYTSNIFAILGLRSLYFALSGVIGRYTHFKYGIAVILAFVGLKMLLAEIYHISVPVSLAVILSVLAITILLSIVVERKERCGNVSCKDPEGP